MPPVQQNDPDELLEVFTASGQPTGRAKTRAAIHLDGDWHRAFHCWILRDGGRQVVLQRRSLVKDTFAGLWDAAAAGHWRFGESAAEAAREIDEELGVHVPFSALGFRGREQGAREFPNGLVDRELHDVYVLEDDRPLRDYRPDPAEVIGVAAFRATDLLGLYAGIHDAAEALECVQVSLDRSVEPTTVRVTRADLVPYSAERLRRTLGTANSH
ncbi:MAG: NUDIX domain-containing protein [Chloroflexi bacterium]|nr:NUDIX domain-containing protein [Chloroflexota bacterium]